MPLKIPAKILQVGSSPATRANTTTTTNASAKPLETELDEKKVGDKKTSYKTVTIRMPEGQMKYLDGIKERMECDQSAAIRRAIRHEFTALSAHNSKLIITDQAGNETSIPLVINGVPV